MQLTRTRKDAAGAKIDPTALYEPLVPYTVGHAVYNRETQLYGSHEAVQAAPGRWLPVEMDSDIKRRLQAEAMTPAYVDYSPPRPKSEQIPPERQVFGVEAFTAGPDVVYRGQVLDIKHRLVKRYPELFRRPPMPIDPQEAA